MTVEDEEKAEWQHKHLRGVYGETKYRWFYVTSPAFGPAEVE